MHVKKRNHTIALLALSLATACGGASTPPPGDPVESATEPAATAPAIEPAASTAPAPLVASDAHRALVDAPDRLPEDRALDAGRKPAELLTFAGVAPGMKVADLGAGTGYTTELLARAVGPTGTVYGQNSKMILGFARDRWPARLARPVNARVVRVDREFDAPLPPEAKDLDVVTFVLLYHDMFHWGVDRDRLNRAVFDALKPGGVYIIVDHSGRPGTGTAETQTLHRIDEAVVAPEVQKAGFQLAGAGDFLRNPADTRDWSGSPMAAGERRGTTDRFVLKFVKPAR